MKSFVITGGATNAYYIRNFLNKNGIKAAVRKSPKNINRIGCSYGVLTTIEGVSLLKKHNITHFGVIDIEG